MTKDQINYIVKDVLADSVDKLTVLEHCQYIQIKEGYVLYTDINMYRYYFDSDLECLKVYRVRPFSTDITKLPSHGNYDVQKISNTKSVVYEIMTDTDGVMMYDIYGYDKIRFFNISEKKE